MRCVADPDPGTFAELAWDFIDREPELANVLATIVAAARELPVRPEDRWWRVLDGGGAVAGVAVRTPPRGVLLSPMPEAAARTLADASAGEVLPTADGPVAEVAAFARRYAELTGCRTEPGMAQRVFRLDRVDPPEGIPGRARAAGPADRDLVRDWLARFTGEATPDQPRVEQTGLLDRRLAGGLVWLWEVDGAPVSLAMRSATGAGPRQPRLVRISAVYTPPPLRGYGYASANVATVSQAALDAGAPACVLYADLSNPVSNKIYQRVGYRPVGAAREWLFRRG